MVYFRAKEPITPLKRTRVLSSKAAASQLWTPTKWVYVFDCACCTDHTLWFRSPKKHVSGSSDGKSSKKKVKLTEVSALVSDCDNLYLSTILWIASTCVPFNSTCLIQSSVWSECPIRPPTLSLLPCWKFNFHMWPIQPRWHWQFNLSIQPFNWLVVFNSRSGHSTDPIQPPIQPFNWSVASAVQSPKCVLAPPSLQVQSILRASLKLNWMVHGYRQSKVWCLLLKGWQGG